MTSSASTASGAPAGRRPGDESQAHSHPVFARMWTRMSGRVGSPRQRAELLAGLSGRVLEVGAGDGRNFGHYPATVTEVLAIEPEPYLRERAREAAARAPVPIAVADGTAETVPDEDDAFHGVVSSLVLCTVPDQHAALSELRRVLAPGGELRFFEHVVAERRIGRALQGRLDSSGIWPRLGAGCHLSRDTVAAISAAGFRIERVRRISSGAGGLGIPFVLGSARH